MNKKTSSRAPDRQRAGRGEQRRANPDRDGTRSQSRQGGRRQEPATRNQRLINLVSIQLQTNFTRTSYNAQELLLEPGEHVVVETPRGPTLGTVRSQVQRRFVPPEGIMRVLRKASVEDLRQAQSHERREQEAYRFAIERIRSRDLPMKLIRAQFMHDGSKIVFFFSAEGRVDFRDLVKDLAHKFRTRIEMHQIGVRDGARMLGGVGPCGRELCCSTFLENFAPVSIRMAKDQGLTLNPKKVSGMCGRLMCCLVYEQQLYKSMRRRMPRAGTTVYTEAGMGVIISVDVINSRALVELEDTNRRTFPLIEITTQEPKAREVLDAPAPPMISPDFLWEDFARDFDEELIREAQHTPTDAESAEQSATPQAAPERKRRARRRKPRQDAESATPSADATQAAPSSAQQQPANAQGDDNAQRRRRRSRRRGDGNKGEGGQGGASNNEQSSANSNNAQAERPKRARRPKRQDNKPQGQGQGQGQGQDADKKGGADTSKPKPDGDEQRRRRRSRRRKKEGGPSTGNSSED